MKKTSFLICCLAVLSLGTGSLVAQEKKKSPETKANMVKEAVAAQKGESVSEPKDVNQLRAILQKSKKERWSERVLWQRLDQLEKQAPSWQLYQQKAILLFKSKYRVLAADYALRAIKESKRNFGNEVRISWEIVAKVADKRVLFEALVQLANEMLEVEGLPRYLGRNWNYYKGIAYQRKGDLDNALASLSSVVLGDRLFRAAKYERAMMLVEADRLDDALADLKIVTSKETNIAVPEPESKEGQYLDLAYLATGRILYEKKEYMDSIRAFRKVSREGDYFYDALWEQAWSLFLAGYPNHALGMLHGAKSPYFSDRFNPEMSILRSFVLYWMCRYDDSRNALADFLEDHAQEVAKLGEFLDRSALTPETAYQLFENTISGVSEESLGFSRPMLLSTAMMPPVMIERNQLANLMTELTRIKKVGVRGSKSVSLSVDRLQQLIKDAKNRLGQSFISELQAMRELFNDYRRQADFLYLELIMSEKEQLAGKELHKETKITKLPENSSLKGWAKGTQKWGSSNKNEFWSDEIGFYILDLKPQCGS